jgi:hypothetical protein
MSQLPTHQISRPIVGLECQLLVLYLQERRPCILQSAANWNIHEILQRSIWSVSFAEKDSVETRHPFPGNALGPCFEKDERPAGQLDAKLLFLLRIVVADG